MMNDKTNMCMSVQHSETKVETSHSQRRRESIALLQCSAVQCGGRMHTVIRSCFTRFSSSFFPSGPHYTNSHSLINTARPPTPSCFVFPHLPLAVLSTFCFDTNPYAILS